MSKTIVLGIPQDVIECSIMSNLSLEGPISVWAAGFDEVGCNVFFAIEVEDEDADKMFLYDLDCHELEEGELLQ